MRKSFFYSPKLSVFLTINNFFGTSFSGEVGSFLIGYFQADPEPFSVYHPTTEEIFTALGTPMEGFFDGAEVVTKAMAFPFAAAQGIHTKTPIPSTEPSPIEEGA